MPVHGTGSIVVIPKVQDSSNSSTCWHLAANVNRFFLKKNIVPVK